MASPSQHTPSRESELIEKAWLQESGTSVPSSKPGGASSAIPFARGSAVDDLSPGMFGGYAIVREIQRGGQGVVYEAIQAGTRQRVAIKVLREGPFAGSHEKSRFQREVRVLGQLKHPNIVSIHHSGQTHGCCYFVMDFVAGDSVDAYVSSHKLSIRETLALSEKVCGAVQSAHLRGVVHRDLKPSNIRMDGRGEPQVLDFGLAMLTSVDAGPITRTPGVTVSGQFMGSLPWASPEQAEGDPQRIDLRTDVYSLGVLLYQLLTGRFPYAVIGHVRDVIGRILEADPTPPSTIRRDIDDELETILLKCLTKEPARRYQSAEALACDIRHYLLDEPIDAKRDSTLYVLRKQLRRHRVPLVVTAGIMVLILVSSIVAWTLYGQARENLWESYLAQARATRTVDRPGRRLDSLKVLRKAAAIKPSIELRNEAIAAMALTDLRILKEVETGVRTPIAVECEPDQSGRLYWQIDLSTGKSSVRRAEDAQTLVTLPPRPYRAKARFSPNSRYIATASSSGCEVWDIDHARLVKRVSVDVSHIGHPFAFSPDGREIAIGTEDGSIHILSFTSDKKRVLPSASGPIHQIRYDAASKFLATSSVRSRDVLMRDALSGEILHTLEHPQRVWQIALSPDGAQLAAGCDDANAYLWNTQTGRRQFTLKGHMSVVDDVGFNSTGALLYTAAWDGTTRLWDPRAGSLQLTIPGMSGRGFGTDSDRLMLSTEENGISLVFAQNVPSKVLRSFVGRPTQGTNDRCQWLRTSGNGRWIASASGTGVRVWDAVRGEQLAFLSTGASASAVFDPRSSTLVTVSETGVLRWPIDCGLKKSRIGPPVVLYRPSHGALYGSCFTANGETLLVASDESEGYVLVLDPEGHRKTRRIGPHRGVRYIAQSPDDRWLATGAWKGKGVKIWALASGELVHELPIERNANVAFSPDGEWLVTSEAEHIIWRTGTWQECARFRRPTGGSVPGPIAFSPDGHLLALSMGAPPFKAMLIDLTRLEQLASLEFPGNIVGSESLAFTPGGTRLLFPNPKEGRILYAWDLREIRTQLASMNLDWDLPPYPPAPTTNKPELIQWELVREELEPSSLFIHTPALSVGHSTATSN